VSCLDENTIIKKYDAWVVDEELSLHCMIESCLDLENETKELQSTMGEQMGLEDFR
jgi:hypothetical protein